MGLLCVITMGGPGGVFFSGSEEYVGSIGGEGCAKELAWLAV